MFRGLQLCLNLGIHHLVIEYHCQTLVKELQSKEPSTSFVENIIQDLKDMMTSFHVCFVSFGYRQSNVATHKFARFACNIKKRKKHCTLVWCNTRIFISYYMVWENTMYVGLVFSMEGYLVLLSKKNPVAPFVIFDVMSSVTLLYMSYMFT